VYLKDLFSGYNQIIMRNLFIIFYLFVLSEYLAAQNASSMLQYQNKDIGSVSSDKVQDSYIRTDSSVTTGVKIVEVDELTKYTICRLENGKETTDYSPIMLTEYGTTDGRVFISKEIQIAGTPRRVFLERLVKGKSTLYFYLGKNVKTFYLERANAFFLEIPKYSTDHSSFKNQLKSLTSDCPQLSRRFRFIIYSRNSISGIIRRYNRCF